MRIVLAGASGFLGSHLRRRLARDGHDLVQLVRRPPAHNGQRQWWPDRHQLDPATMDGVDAVVNLAGLGVEDKRWDAQVRAELVSSRVDPTTTLATAIAELPASARPGVLVNASAVGYYGDTGDRETDEESPAGTGFFPDLCQRWESATDSATRAGVRVVRLRTGLVLDAGGGLLKPMLLAFRLFAGGNLSSGRQWMPWISIRDWTSAVTLLLVESAVDGPVNLVGPDPVRNAEFTKALGRAVHRPALIPVPRFALRIVLGEFANEALASQRVLPAVLNRAGFSFADADLDAALRSALQPS
jgi:uncharacterized protein (TIGR01777 family)